MAESTAAISGMDEAERIEVLEDLVGLLEVQNEHLQAFKAGLQEIESRLAGRVIERGEAA